MLGTRETRKTMIDNFQNVMSDPDFSPHLLLSQSKCYPDRNARGPFSFSAPLHSLRYLCTSKTLDASLQIIAYEKGSEMKGVAEVMGRESEESSRISVSMTRKIPTPNQALQEAAGSESRLQGHTQA